MGDVADGTGVQGIGILPLICELGHTTLEVIYKLWPTI